MLSLFCALLELIGDKDLIQHEFTSGDMTNHNADRYTSVLGITKAQRFRDFDPVVLHGRLSKSHVFSDVAIDVQGLVGWSTKAIVPLRICFSRGYLVRH